jgi:electron transport complex protein RnfC
MIEFCGGLKKDPAKIINGGPMMGVAQWDINAPVTKTTSSILVFAADTVKSYNYSKPDNRLCIRCGKCVQVCPKRLMPTYLAIFAKNASYDMCDEFSALSCTECGTCSYVCPANVPIVSYIKVAKQKINESRIKK